MASQRNEICRLLSEESLVPLKGLFSLCLEDATIVKRSSKGWSQEVGCACSVPPSSHHISLPNNTCTQFCITTEDPQRHLLVHKGSSGIWPHCTLCAGGYHPTPPLPQFPFSLSLESGKSKRTHLYKPTNVKNAQNCLSCAPPLYKQCHSPGLPAL